MTHSGWIKKLNYLMKTIFFSSKKNDEEVSPGRDKYKGSVDQEVGYHIKR